MLADDGRVHGESTDGEGFLRALADEGQAVADRDVLVVGAGGAARAIVRAVGDAGGRVTVAARRVEKAQVAAGLTPGAKPVALDGLDVAPYGIVVQATPVGMRGEPAPFATEGLGPDQFVYDTVYPGETPLVAAARARGRGGSERHRDARAPGRDRVRALHRARRPARRDASRRRRVNTRHRAVMVTLTALLWAGLVAAYQDSWVLPAYLVLAAGLVVLSVIDIREHRLPNRIVYPLTLAVAALLVVAAIGDDDWSAFGRALLAGVVAVAAFAGLHLASPRSLGLGDVKLVGVLGLALGWLGLGRAGMGRDPRLRRGCARRARARGRGTARAARPPAVRPLPRGRHAGDDPAATSQVSGPAAGSLKRPSASRGPPCCAS